MTAKSSPLAFTNSLVIYSAAVHPFLTLPVFPRRRRTRVLL